MPGERLGGNRGVGPPCFETVSQCHSEALAEESVLVTYGMHEILHCVQNDIRGIFVITTQSLRGGAELMKVGFSGHVAEEFIFKVNRTGSFFEHFN